MELVRDCYYDDPLEVAANRFSCSDKWFSVENLIQLYLPGKVLDIGAGCGISSYAFDRLGCDATALELDPGSLVGAEAIQNLMKNAQLPIKIVQDFGEVLPFESNTFDIVYGRAVLHRAQDLNKLCAEASRVLKPGGIFITTREHVISKRKDLPLFLENHSLHHLYGGENAFLLKGYKAAIKNSGLILQKEIGPYDNVINYAPRTEQSIKNNVETTLTRILGKKLGYEIAKNKLIQNFCVWLYSKTTNQLGRHYSFLAVKNDYSNSICPDYWSCRLYWPLYCSVFLRSRLFSDWH